MTLVNSPTFCLFVSLHTAFHSTSICMIATWRRSEPSRKTIFLFRVNQKVGSECICMSGSTRRSPIHASWHSRGQYFVHLSSICAKPGGKAADLGQTVSAASPRPGNRMFEELRCRCIPTRQKKRCETMCISWFLMCATCSQTVPFETAGFVLGSIHPESRPLGFISMWSSDFRRDRNCLMARLPSLCPAYTRFR